MINATVKMNKTYGSSREIIASDVIIGAFSDMNYIEA